MFFTQEDYKKIYNWIRLHAIKDTEFSEAKPLDGREVIAIVQEGHNVRFILQDFLEQLSLLNIPDFVNVTERYDLKYISLFEATKAIPYRSRKIGQVITFLDEDGNWKIYQFRGEKRNQWNILTLWVDILQDIIDKGNILPDEEDLTAVKEGDKTVVKFKDKPYNPDNFSGKGRVYLRKNITEVIDNNTKVMTTKNLLTQKMLGKEDTVYIVQYDYDLNGQEITIPKGCILKFEDGSITNGVINNIDTIINKYNFNCAVKGYIYNINGKRISNNGVFIYNTDVELQMSISDFSDEWMYENFEFLENIGISDVVLCPQLIFDENYNISYRYNNAKFENITKIISKYNINIVGVKFHQQTGFDKTVQNGTLAKNWTNFLKQEIDKYASINTIKYVYIINENNDWATTGSIYIPYILEINDYIKSKGLISCISYVNSYRLSLVDNQFSAIDVNALNYYPTLSFMDENASVDEVMINNIRKDISNYIHIAKTVFGNTVYGISETGTMNKVKSLRFPWETNPDNTGATSNTNTPLHVYYDAFFAGIQGINNLKFINLFFISPYNNRERQNILINQLKKYNYVI